MSHSLRSIPELRMGDREILAKKRAEDSKQRIQGGLLIVVVRSIVVYRTSGLEIIGIGDRLFIQEFCRNRTTAVGQP